VSSFDDIITEPTEWNNSIFTNEDTIQRIQFGGVSGPEFFPDWSLYYSQDYSNDVIRAKSQFNPHWKLTMADF